MLLVQSHTSDIAIETVLEAPSRFTIFGIPYIDGSLTGNIKFKSDRGEKSA
jgi:hypothetical protein